MAEFADALSKAVEASGLSLERIQHHLELRGVQVSLSTLSYWRRGRSRPERPESLAAVAALEEILRLEPGALTGSLGEKRPRGRWVERAAALEGIWQEAAIDLGRAIARVDKLMPYPAKYLSVRDLAVIGPDRREIEMRTSSVIEAFEDGVDRILVARTADETDHSPGEILAEKSCRVGRVRRDSEHKLLVAEIILDRVLRAGDTALIDLRYISDPGADSVYADRSFVRPLRDYVLEVEFHPDAVPVRCYGYVRSEPGGPDVDTGDLWIGTTAAAHLVVHEAQPGCVYGIKWEWE
ncbi:XRE family transcriptional regulator [Lentzea alba]|uniref:XRE family transcriptional regulator n=1 Tax=Lentzea alba TaxID=2714351 RepID=UPI0039BED8BD